MAVSTTSNTDPSAFTTIEEWTLNSDGTGTKSSRKKVQGMWGRFEVDLSAYAGQQGYIAIRHFGCTDQFLLNIDDIGIYDFENIPVGEWQTIETTKTEVTINGLRNGTTYDYQIIGKKEGEENAATNILSFTTQSTVTIDNILFADANVKKICVEYWDTNHDGELSEAEAAAVNYFGLTVFGYNTEITSFNELEYFTGLTSIGKDAFSRCTSLKSITIPKNVISIEEGAFTNCESLTSILIPSK